MKILGLLCNWCSYAGADLAGVSRYQYPPTIRVVRVMCSTRVEPFFIIKAFLKGVDGVLVGGCHLGDCHYVTGNYYTIGKIYVAKKLLKFAGVNPSRLRLEWISASEGEKFARIVDEFSREIEKLGPLKEELKDDTLLKVAYNVSIKPRARIIAGKHRMLTFLGNKYDEIYTNYEFDRIGDEILRDEMNIETIKFLINEGKGFDEISKFIDKKILYLYLLDMIKNGELSFREENGKYVFLLENEIKKEEKDFSLDISETKDISELKKAHVIIGGGAYGINKAIELSKNGENVVIVEKYPSINKYTIRKHLSSLNDDCKYDEFLALVKEGKIFIANNSIVKSIRDGVVKIIKYPTRVNENCNNCNICYEICPVRTVDREQTIFSRKAIYGRNGAPSTFFLEKESPFCQTNCPAHVDVRGYVARIAEGDFEGAINLIRERLPLPGVLGRVCPHPCEEICRRNGIDGAISIRLLKRFVADWEWENKGKIDLGKMPVNENSKYKIAVIGSGPAGLTVAYELARMGYKVKIFEALPVAGGMLAVGIPPYRLPKDVLNREINAILEMGVEIQLNCRIGKDISFEEIRKNFDAIFIGVGAHKSRKMGIEGENLKGVIPGVDFLREVNIYPENVRAIISGKKVVVIGGGDVAIDAARCAIRFGCDVTILYRRSRQEMPAREEEIRYAEEEGVNFLFLTAPLKIVGKESVEKIECVKMELGEPDESGRRKPVPKKGSEFFIEADVVISAIGQQPDLSFLPDEIKKDGLIYVDENTGTTSLPGVFAGGDAVSGPSIVIEAVAWGRRVAKAIDAYLHGKKIDFDPVERDINRMIASYEDVDIMKRNVVLSIFGKEKRKNIEEISIDERISTFKEVEKGFDKKTAVSEANRCLACRACLGCGICGNECIKNAIDYEEKEKEIEIFAKSIEIDPEIKFNHEFFTPFEVEDILDLGIIMDFNAEKLKKICFLNFEKNKYFEELKERILEKGIEICDADIGVDFKIDFKYSELPYYKRIRRMFS
ncbi:MAG: hydrogenase iron-sulfur subunit [Thermoplasmatales archaeon]|nr:hydrogenase iron-sulfur subunit [Thermoplasmatales archaeon]